MVMRFVLLVWLIALVVVTASAQQADMLWLQRGNAGGNQDLQISEDGATYITVGSGGVKRWETSTGRLLGFYAPPISAYNVIAAYSPDGRYVSVYRLNSSYALELYDAVTTQVIHSVQDTLQRCRFSSDGSYFASIQGAKVTIRKIPSMIEVARIDSVSTYYDVFFTHDSRYMLFARKNVFYSFDLVSRTVTNVLPGDSKFNNSISLAILGDEVAGVNNREIVIWDLTGNSKKIVNLDNRSWLSSSNPSYFFSIAMNGSFVAFARPNYSPSNDSTILIFDLETGKIIAQYSIPTQSYIKSIKILPEGSQLLVATNDGVVYYIDPLSGSLMRAVADVHYSRVMSSAVSVDGRYMISGENYGRLILWDGQTGERLWTYNNDGYYSIESVAFSPDGSGVAASTRLRLGQNNIVPVILIFNRATGTVQQTLTHATGTVTSLVFTSDGKHIVSGSSDGVVRTWDLETGYPTQTFIGHGLAINDVAVSPDGSRIASASEDWTVKLWDAATGSVLRTFSGHGGPVNSVTFSPSGQALISASSDSTLREWSTATGATRLFTGHSGAVCSARLSSNGAWIFSAGEDGKVLAWDRVGAKIVRTWIDSALGSYQSFTSLSVDSALHGIAVTAADGSVMMLKPGELSGSSGPVTPSVDETEPRLYYGAGSDRGTVTFQTTKDGRCRITLINLLGEEAMTIADTWLETGEQTITWSAEGLPSGAYFMRFVGDGINATSHVIVIR